MVEQGVVMEWVRFPVCGNKTRLQIWADTELTYFSFFYYLRRVLI
ncbi:MAG: hypothetical protein HDR02_12170 [Lachnospiraceae bacterium]|nr:hypothetical protein [Lachnospiraceae bacterium]